MSADRQGLIAALDVGSSKVGCFIARMDPQQGLTILGVGHRLCVGVKGGAVVDIIEAERAIRAAVQQAETLAGETVESVIVSFSAGQLQSQVIEVDVAIDGHRVEEADIARVLAEARAAIDPGDRVVIHAFPACFGIDGSYGVRAPVGMYGDRLAVTMHVVSAAAGPVRNLESAIQKAHLTVSRFVAGPYASGLATLVEDERDLGAAVVDLGAGSTQIAVFAAGAMVHLDIVPLGAGHVTQDIARGLITPLDHAERLKTVHGNAIQSAQDDREDITVPQMGETEFDEDGASQISRSALTGIIQPRLEEILEFVRDRLVASGFEGTGARRVVLTGGGAQMPGIRDLAQTILDKQVRIGKPVRIAGSPDATSGPAFATCTGLLLFSILAPKEALEMQADKSRAEPQGPWARMGRWLKDNF
ncbi:cell division protein FtsA [alpha proteobacterium Q-1]|nr:cell division protein FtsA [alpha proteobacterium Q-1]